MSSFQEMSVADIREDFFVRKARDEDRVLILGELYEAHADIPPILLWRETLILVDGRHRLAAERDLLGRTKVRVKLVSFASRADAIAYAFRANLSKGPMEPKPQDYRHTIQLLLDEGLSEKQIVLSLSESSPIPARMYRNFITAIKSDQKRARARSAVRLVAAGEATVAEAARRFNVDENEVRRLIDSKANKADAAHLQGVLGEISAKTRAFGAYLGAVSRRAEEAYDLGDVDSAYVESVYAYIQRRLNDFQSKHADRTARFKANGGSKNVESKPAVALATNGHDTNTPTNVRGDINDALAKLGVIAE